MSSKRKNVDLRPCMSSDDEPVPVDSCLADRLSTFFVCRLRLFLEQGFSPTPSTSLINKTTLGTKYDIQI